MFTRGYINPINYIVISTINYIVIGVINQLGYLGGPTLYHLGMVSNIHVCWYVHASTFRNWVQINYTRFLHFKKMRMGWNSQAEQCWEAHRRDRIWTQMSCRKSTQPKCLTNPSRWNYITHVKICVALFVRHLNSPPIDPFVLFFFCHSYFGGKYVLEFLISHWFIWFICGIWMNLDESGWICWE